MSKVCVVDASVVLKWFLPEPDSATADYLLEQFLNNEVELLAPDIMLIEAANALWKRVVFQKLLSANEATLIHRDLLTLPFALIDSESLASAAFQVALQHNHPVYDSLYCALAIARRCDFVTADRTLANKLRDVFPFIVHLSAIKQ
jgi:predicted nucleic acid-binding protein